MKLHKNPKKLTVKNPVITIGTFDGVHLGHKEIIDSLKEIAAETNGESMILTFWPHPRKVLSPDAKLKLINTMEEKMSLLEQAGIDNLVIYQFTKEFSQLTANEFVKEYLVKKIGAKTLVFGYDHLFGRNKEGDFNKLKELGKEFGFKVVEVDALSLENNNISSTMVRNLLDKGDITKANRYLGYNFFLTGFVKDGHKVGRTIGFPTANIEVTDPNKLIPGDGVYAVKVILDGSEYSGMMNIGYRPTVNTGYDSKSLEVNIFNFAKDIYNKEVEIRFIAKIRDEMKFENVQLLTNQLIKDKKQALEILGSS